MASYYMLRPLYTSHLLYPSPSPPDRICCLRLRSRSAIHLSSLRCMRDWRLRADFSSLSASPTSSTVVVVPHGNYPGRVDAVVDAGTEVSDPRLILDTQSLSKESTAPPSLPGSNGSASNGTALSDLDFEIYASNSMEGFEPPPPPRIPFGGPFEDYYGEHIGEDYIPKQEKPTSSFLMFLDSLNAKRAEEEANAEKNPKKPLFSSSRPVPSSRQNRPLFSDNRPLFPQSRSVGQPAATQPTAEEKPLLPETRPVQGAAEVTSSSSPLLAQSSNVQETTDASSRPLIPQNRPVDVTPSFPESQPSEVSEELSVLSRQTRSVEELKEQNPPFSPTSTAEQSSSSDRPLFPQTRMVQDSRDPSAPTTRTTEESRDSFRPLSPQTRMGELPKGSSMPSSPQTRISEENNESSRPFSTQTRVTEELRDSNRSLSPQLRTTEETMGSRPLSPSTRSFEDTRDIKGSSFPKTRPVQETGDNSRSFYPQTRSDEEVRKSSQPLFPQSRPMNETRDGSGPLSPQSRPVEEIRDSRRPFEDFRDSRTLVSQSRPLEETRDVRPLIPQTRRVDEARPLVPQTRSVEETRDSSQSISSQAGSSEENSRSSRSLFPQTRPIEATGDNRTSFAQTRPVEETLDSSRPLLSQSTPLEEIRDDSRPSFPQSRPVDVNRDDGQPLSPRTRPAEGITDNTQFLSGNGETIPQNTWTGETSKAHVDQVNGVMSAKLESSTLTGPATVTNAPDDSAEAVTKSQFYEPREGDIILGAVTFANDQELDIEIGAKLPALMSLRDFQPFPQIVDNAFFKLPPTDGSNQILEGFVAPHGKSLLVEDRTANDGSYHDEMVDIGMVVIAEVQGRAVTDGRAVLSCRLPARRLAWHRIEQLMRLGEIIQLEVVQWNEGGLLGYLEGVRAFIPRSELVQRPESTAVLKDYVGRTLSVAILQADKQASNCILSEVKPWMSKNLQLGTVHDVIVTRIYPYGMQVQVDNTRIRGFVHISNISKEFVSSVTSLFAEGDKARAMLIKGRNPGQVSFSIADLESDRGLIFQDKEQVFQGAEEMARSFREGLSDKERQIFGIAASETSLDFQDLGIANLNWLHIRNVINS